MTKPTLIVFEGIDGSGKTTQARMLNDYLNANGVKSLYKHVFDSKAGKLLREVFIQNNFSNIVEILVLCATRQAFLDDFLDEKEGCDVIIIDRFFLSILAMQGTSDKDIKLIHYIRDSIWEDLPDAVVFYLNTSPAECKRRLNGKDKLDRIEGNSVAFHEKIFDRYVDLINSEQSAYTFDGNKDVKTIHRNIVDKAISVLGSRHKRR